MSESFLDAVANRAADAVDIPTAHVLRLPDDALASLADALDVDERFAFALTSRRLRFACRRTNHRIQHFARAKRWAIRPAQINPLCQERPLWSRSEARQADPLTLCDCQDEPQKAFSEAF